MPENKHYYFDEKKRDGEEDGTKTSAWGRTGSATR
jgi:hypothetical protein